MSYLLYAVEWDPVKKLKDNGLRKAYASGDMIGAIGARKLDAVEYGYYFEVANALEMLREHLPKDRRQVVQKTIGRLFSNSDEQTKDLGKQPWFFATLSPESTREVGRGLSVVEAREIENAFDKGCDDDDKRNLASYGSANGDSEAAFSKSFIPLLKKWTRLAQKTSANDQGLILICDD